MRTCRPRANQHHQRHILSFANLLAFDAGVASHTRQQRHCDQRSCVQLRHLRFPQGSWQCWMASKHVSHRTRSPGQTRLQSEPSLPSFEKTQNHQNRHKAMHRDDGPGTAHANQVILPDSPCPSMKPWDRSADFGDVMRSQQAGMPGYHPLRSLCGLKVLKTRILVGLGDHMHTSPMKHRETHLLPYSMPACRHLFCAPAILPSRRFSALTLYASCRLLCPQDESPCDAGQASFQLPIDFKISAQSTD